MRRKNQNQLYFGTHHFSSAFCKLQVIYRNSDNFTVLIFPVVISWSSYFVIDFLTVSYSWFFSAQISPSQVWLLRKSERKWSIFPVPFMHYTDDILLKRRSSNEDTTFNAQFMHPFHDDVWVATLVTLMVISVSTFALNYFSPYGYKDKNGKGTSEDFSFINSVWFTWSCMLQQGAETQPRSLSGTALESK